MSLLTIIQSASVRCGVPSPSTVIGSTDKTVLKMTELSNEDGKELARRHPWQRMVTEATHTTVATESQGAITTIAGTDFNYIVEDTVWNRTLVRRWIPVNREQWQTMKARTITGPDCYFRLRGNTLITIPVPTAGQTVAFEYVSKNWCESSGGTGQAAWADDTDVGLIDEDILVLGVVWRWKQAQGLEYAEDFSKYERLIADAIATDSVNGTLNMNSRRLVKGGKGYVPEGSWSL